MTDIDSVPSCGQENDYRRAKMFRCNCPHEVRAGCSEPKCPHYAPPSATQQLSETERTHD